MRIRYYVRVAIPVLVTFVASPIAAVPLTASRLQIQAAPLAGSALPRVDDATMSGSVAVIPFTNVSRDEADDWIGDGIAETVTADLESLGGLTVIAQERVRAVTGRLGGSDVDGIMETVLGRELGARWIVTGGYQRLGSQLRITARLVDTVSGLVARTVKADGALNEIFELQDRIAAELTSDVRSSTMAPRGLRVGGGAGPSSAVATVGGGAETVVAGSGELDGEDNGAMATGDGGRPGAVATAASAGILTGRPSVTAVRAGEPPRIDGLLDDAVWQRAIRLTEFVQVRPVEGAPATEDTEFWIAYDSGNVYMAMHAHYTNPGMVRANRVERDKVRNDDTISGLV